MEKALERAQPAPECEEEEEGKMLEAREDPRVSDIRPR